MTAFISWYLLVTVIGLMAWPLTYHLLPALPDRGVTISRAVGLLVAGYIFWLLTSLGLLGNTPGGILFALFILGIGTIWALIKQGDASLLGWVRENWRTVLTSELVFLIAFAAWAVVRAMNPDITGTEKPMEMAFLNGIRTSEVFPPRDPWLSSYAISYYYFGYVIIAMLSDLSGLPSGITFNLGIALLFALTLQGAYGLLVNLLQGHFLWLGEDSKPGKGLAITALLGPFFLGIMGNLMGFFDTLRALNPAFIPAGFWVWLDIDEVGLSLTQAVWPPYEARYLWWWRASRVIHDRTPIGESIGLQPIDEFPFFSFLLADMHPHVLALPFVILALVLAYHALLQAEPLNRIQVGFYALIYGGLAFLNAWDFPIYLFVLLVVLVARAFRERHNWRSIELVQQILPGLLIAGLGIVAYFPWLVSFSSQAGGILPNALFPTRFHQLLVMFGPFLFIIFWFLIWQGVRQRVSANWVTGFAGAIGLLVLLTAFMVTGGTLAMNLDEGVRHYVMTNIGFPTEGLSPEQMLVQVPDTLGFLAKYRLSRPITPLLLTVIMGITLALLIPRSRRVETEKTSTLETSIRPISSPSVAFGLILVVTGTLLVLGPEFVYLRDNFGQRINTIFKFYYAAWVLFTLAAAFAANLIGRERTLQGGIFVPILVVLCAASLCYPAFGLPSRIGNIDLVNRPLSLNGLGYIQDTQADEYEAILWLQDYADVDDIILEAVGGAYSTYGRISSVTGIPTVMGWSNHERQWRGDLYPLVAGNRENDVRDIYSTPSIGVASDLIHYYGVTLVYVGPLEHSAEFTPGGGLDKFDRMYMPVFQNRSVTIYRTDLPVVAEEFP